LAAFVPLLISPAVTFAAFTAITRATGASLDTARMFTSLSLLSLLTQPLSQSFQNIPSFLAAVGCFQRIQAFLLTDTMSDHRLMIGESDTRTVFSESETDQYGIELRPVIPNTESSSRKLSNTDAIVIRHGTFGWNSSEEHIFQDIDVTIKTSQLTMIIGPVASGKSTLLKAFLGETPSSKGFVHITSMEIAFCDQTPWLKNGTVQKNVLGFFNFDSLWYNAVIHACGLEEDLVALPMGDQSLIGSKGITLSGGQKQRIVCEPKSTCGPSDHRRRLLVLCTREEA
jgi:ATP-binding cassette subfamily C (CFTR/MRP) protein 1